MKAIEQYFQVVLFIMLYKMFLTFKFANKPLVCDHSNESFEQYFQVVLFNMLYKVFLTFKFANKPLVCDHSNESFEQYFEFHVVLLIIRTRN